ncbi:ornithine carbamoyltransferase [Streptomyces xanthochromogenes]|uniref:ornithine carbamoyltransferase n=1 Tax=Streptomyces xanthochromogenes TaxID=67384 RepID=UPI0038231907
MLGRHILGMTDFDADELRSVLSLAERMKSGDDTHSYLTGTDLGLLFHVPSTRTRVSFQVAAAQLGGRSYTYGPEELRLANNETVEDTAGVLSRYLSALVVRWYDMADYGAGHRRLHTMAEHSSIPVINALDDEEHPCQVLADLLTLRERFGDELPRKRVVYTWAYSSRQKTPGVLHSSLLAAALLGHHVTFAHPPGFELDERYVKEAQTLAAASGARLDFVEDMAEAVRGSDAVYVQSWKSLRLPGQHEWQARTRLADRWRVTEPVMALAVPGAPFLDCMPSNRGEEMDAEVKDGPRSLIFDQAENRLHAQKALLAQVIGSAPSTASASADSASGDSASGDRAAR